jgi:hypothetical protein
MKRIFTVPVLLSFAILAVALLAGAPFTGDPFTGALLVGQVAAAGVAQYPWRRVRKDLPSFENVVATGRATAEVPRYAMTLLGLTLRLGGTTFNETHITEIRLRLGSKTIWGPVTGAHLRKMNAYKGYDDNNRQFQHVDLVQPGSKTIGGAMVGGIDMSKLPAGRLIVEVTTSGATAPTLDAKAHWGPPQGNDVMQKLLQYAWSTSGTGRRVVPFEFRGARVRRMFAIYDGTGGATSFENTAAATAWTGNTGDGAMGAVTVADGCQVGTHKFICVEPGGNVGTFAHFLPDGSLNSLRMIVAAAYSSGGLAFTLADGNADFIPGDGFDIVVSRNTDGNLNRGEVIKNGESVWDLDCTEARELQMQYGLKPQSLMYVFDFEVDGWPDGALPTADAVTLEWAVHLTAADNVVFYAEVLDSPQNN